MIGKDWCKVCTMQVLQAAVSCGGVKDSQIWWRLTGLSRGSVPHSVGGLLSVPSPAVNHSLFKRIPHSFTAFCPRPSCQPSAQSNTPCDSFYVHFSICWPFEKLQPVSVTMTFSAYNVTPQLPYLLGACENISP